MCQIVAGLQQALPCVLRSLQFHCHCSSCKGLRIGSFISQRDEERERALRTFSTQREQQLQMRASKRLSAQAVVGAPERVVKMLQAGRSKSQSELLSLRTVIMHRFVENAFIHACSAVASIWVMLT